MSDSIKYYESVKGKEHVFLYSVAGRSSSTAFQRILNSSNKVWIWGEQNKLIDHTVFLINEMRKHNANERVKDSLSMLEVSFGQNKHLQFYPNAIGNLDSNIALISSSISNLLKPKAEAIDRFGFKDIDPVSIKTIEYLKEIFPQSIFIFCFRDPMEQWPSVSKLKWFPYSGKLSLFLDEYIRISDIYLEYADKNGINPFVENIDLRNTEKIRKIIEYTRVAEIDYDLIDLTVHSANAYQLSNSDKKTILKSKAYKNYLKMKSLSYAFYQYPGRI